MSHESAAVNNVCCPDDCESLFVLEDSADPPASYAYMQASSVVPLTLYLQYDVARVQLSS